MSADWPEYRLGDITKWTSGGTPPKAKSEYWNGSIPWISASSMHGNRYETSDLKINKAGLKNGSRLAQKDSILLLVRGSSLHQRIPVGIATKDVAFNQDVKALKVDEEIVDPWFILFWFMAKEKELLSLVGYTGIGAGKFDIKQIQDLIIKVPPHEEQKRIVSFIKDLDDKIEVNQQINQTLEQIAQAIFKSWFIDFDPVKAKIAAKAAGRDPERAAMCAISGKTDAELDQLTVEQRQQLAATAALFPDELVESELGLMPEGWEVCPLSEMIRLIGGGTPKKSEPSFWGGDIPWFSVKDAPNDGDIFVLDTSEKITKVGLDKSSTKLLSEGATIISARGTVGKLALVGTPMAMNQSCYGVVGGRGIGPFYNYFNLKQAVETLRQNTHGAVFDTITRTTFETVKTVNSNGALINMFDDLVSGLMQKIKENLRETGVLSETRDTLLPKILSGKLSICDIITLQEADYE